MNALINGFSRSYQNNACHDIVAGTVGAFAYATSAAIWNRRKLNFRKGRKMTSQLLQSNKGHLLAASAITLALTSGFAQAAPVATWDFTTDTTFTASTFETGGSGTTTQSAYELSWGATGGNFQVNSTDANANRSALTIGQDTGANRTGGGPVSGTGINGINTTIGGSPDFFLGQIRNGTSFTHWNNPISASFNTLTSGTILDTLTLTPSAPGGYTGQAPVSAPQLTFQFNFQETPNGGTGGFCAGNRAIPAAGCEDLFGFAPTTLNNPFQYNDVGLDGLWGTGDDFLRTYYASVFVIDGSGNPFPISQLLPGECSAIGLNAGCFGFRTAEAAQTSAQFAFAVTTDPISIPEPGSLALAGLALAGLAGMRRRKQS
jgi:hypothetical protein